MTTEQKAKAYDEALEKMREFMLRNPQNDVIKKNIQDAFPELKESEDERIRKKLMHIVSSHNAPKWHGLEASKVLSWLEKQKPVEWESSDEHIKASMW